MGTMMEPQAPTSELPLIHFEMESVSILSRIVMELQARTSKLPMVHFEMESASILSIIVMELQAPTPKMPVNHFEVESLPILTTSTPKDFLFCTVDSTLTAQMNQKMTFGSCHLPETVILRVLASIAIQSQTTLCRMLEMLVS
jgi:hypothetical protein